MASSDRRAPRSVVFEDIQAAAARLAPILRPIPAVSSAALDELLGARILLQPESLQHTGSFKIRGALNRLLRLSPRERERGVVAFSSGNHAQAVAAAAQHVGTTAIIVMPADAPAIKLEATKRRGAQVVTYDRYREDREQIAHGLAREEQRVVVPAFDDPDIVAGQGTAGLQIARSAQQRWGGLDAVVVACSGGGLTAGVSLALRHYFPDVATYAVEAEGFAGVGYSLAASRRTAAPGTGRTLCDALMMPMPGRVPWSILETIELHSISVTDAEVETAMAYAAAQFSFVLEPGGAAALAGLLARGSEFAGKRVAVVLSGGNVDRDTFTACLRRARVR